MEKNIEKLLEDSIASKIEVLIQNAIIVESTGVKVIPLEKKREVESYLSKLFRFPDKETKNKIGLTLMKYLWKFGWVEGYTHDSDKPIGERRITGYLYKPSFQSTSTKI